MKVALALREILERLELPSYPKTSGATGLHILLPLGARYTYEETRTFARLLATLAVEAVPRDLHDRADDPARAAARSTSTSARTAPARRSSRRCRCGPLPGAPVSTRCAGRR